MLRHLDFSSSDFKVLPESISMLFNLRSLDISRCNISVLPLSVGSLKNLLFLDISHTPITEIPDSISRIYSLQRLNFRYCKNLEALPRNIGALTQLRSLNLEGSGIVELPDSICRIYNLERLEFWNCSELKALPHKFKALTRLRSLDLEGTKITELPESLTSNLWKFKSVNIRRLEVLVPYLVRKLEQKKNALPVLRTRESRESSGIKELAGIPSLRVLEIRCLENVTGTKDAERADLKYKKNLRELSLKWENEEANNNSVMVLEGLRPHRNLEKLVIENFGGARLPKWMDSSSCYLPNLVELYLSNCNSCKKLPALGVLPGLRVLWIYGMRSMNCLGQEFFYQENDKEEHKEDVEVTILFRSLTRLELGDMDNLEEWVAPPPPYISFPVLETLCIIGCCELTSIPDFQSCTSLQELTIEDCDKLNKEFPSEPITTNRSVFHLLNLIFFLVSYALFI
ncbi:putative disease resistance RPP13-like protein 1 [Papaver somniferum]|uniref:putative disease resistance RPP13-like protein 1 n=1 Tax=Papaver somniferum TaxID=3469 RepID=UPI000E6F5DAB|nr:putative disease resistance RPP13-like protein 1 [Papaver somniferum]